MAENQLESAATSCGGVDLDDTTSIGRVELSSFGAAGDRLLVHLNSPISSTAMSWAKVPRPRPQTDHTMPSVLHLPFHCSCALKQAPRLSLRRFESCVACVLRGWEEEEGGVFLTRTFMCLHSWSSVFLHLVERAECA